MRNKTTRRRAPPKPCVIFRLPAELLSLIARTLHEDKNFCAKRGFIAFSETCRRLRAVAVPYLFHTIRFHLRASFEAHVYCRYTFNCRTPGEFRGLVKKHAAVRENIQEVHIISSQCRTHRSGYVDPPELTSTLCLLPKLRAVFLHEFMFFRDGLARQNEDIWRSTPAPETTTNRPSLEILQLSFDESDWGVMDLTLVFLFISAFSIIDRMNLIDAKFFPSPDCWNMENTLQRLSSESFPRVNLRGLEADGCSNVDGLLPILRDHLLDEHRLQTLRLGVNRNLDPINMKFFEEFLNYTAESLLDVATPLYNLADKAISRCINLQKLSITDTPWTVNHRDDQTLDRLLLSVRNLPCLSTITFLLVSYSYSPLLPVDDDAADNFKTVEAALLQLPALKRVIFCLYQDMVIDEVKFDEAYNAFETETVLTLAPMLHARGMLEVSQSIKMWASSTMSPKEIAELLAMDSE